MKQAVYAIVKSIRRLLNPHGSDETNSIESYELRLVRLLNPHGSDETDEIEWDKVPPKTLLNPHGSDETCTSEPGLMRKFNFLTHTVQMKPMYSQYNKFFQASS